MLILYCYAVSFVPDAPKGDILFFAERLHAPRTLKPTHDKVHWNEHPDLEAVDKLTPSKCIAVADASVHWKHHEVKGVGYLSDVFKFTKEPLFLCHWIDILTELFAKDFSFRRAVNKKACVLVTQVTSMKDGFTYCLNNPAHATVIAAHG